MAEVLVNKQTGKAVIWDRLEGGYREASAEEVQVAGAGVMGMAASAVEGATGIPGLISPETGQALGTVNPGSQAAGLAGTIGTGVFGVGKAAGKAFGRKTVSDRVQERLATQTGRGLKTESGLIKRPQDFAPDLLKPTARAFEGGFESVPFMRIAGDAIKMQRQKVVGTKLMRSLGMSEQAIKESGGKLTRDVFNDVLTGVDARYAGARGALGTRLERNQLQGLLAANQKTLGKELSQELADTKQDDLGEFLLDLRSELRADQFKAKKLRDRKKLNKIIENIQQIIKDAVKDTPIKAELDEADRIYTLWKTVDNSSALTGDGLVNFRSLQIKMNKTYGSRAAKGGRGIRDPLAEDLYMTLDEAAKLGKPLPSSGTAERGIAAGILTGGAVGFSQ